MIKITIDTAITIYICSILIIAFALWILNNHNKQKPIDTTDALEQCPYCTYIFFIYIKKKSHLCPRCKSVIIEEENINNI